jgi:hypothetical protein
MSSHSGVPQAAQKEDDVSTSFSALIFFLINAPTRYYRQSAAIQDASAVMSRSKILTADKQREILKVLSMNK